MRNVKVLNFAGAIVAVSMAATAQRDVPAARNVWLSSELIGMKVVSERGDDLGKIEDLVVHPGGAASYAVLSLEGGVGASDKLFAMPWTVLRTVEADTAKKDSARSLVLPLDKERLKTAPGFDKKSWPALANPSWTRDVDQFYAGDANPNASRATDAAMGTSVITWRVSELKGADVKTPAGSELGDVREIAIDVNGRVSYAALSVGGVLGIGDKWYAVPWDSLVFSLGGADGKDRLITLDTTTKQLEHAPQFKDGKEHRAAMSDPKWIGRVYEYFSCPAY